VVSKDDRSSHLVLRLLEGKMKNILIVDSDLITLNIIAGLLKCQGNFFNVLSTASSRVALEIIASKAIDMVITGPHLPEIANADLMTRIERRYPQIRMILMTAGASQMLRSKTKQRQSVILFDQALDVALLVQRIFSELSIEYGGRIRGVSLPSFLQMMELEDRSCSLLITAKGRTGWLYLRKGIPVASEFGKLTGRLAALQILTWKNVTIDIDYKSPDCPRKITKPLMSLIMESGRLIDEEQRQRPELRKHGRFDCHVAVDYDLSKWTYRSYLLDISMGGAYILTEQPVEIGQKIIISLTSTNDKHNDSFNGVVIRRDARGIGVRFDNLSLRQKEMIEAMRNGQGLARNIK
jgi:CheY-like chemotaxis protein